MGLHRQVGVDVGVVAQLAAAVPAPGPYRAVTLDGQAVEVAGGDGGHPREALDLDGNLGVGRGVVAQLAVGVPAPGPHRAVGLEGVGRRVAAGYGGDVAHALDLDGHR